MEDLLVEVMENVVVGEHLHQQFQLVLLPEVFKAAIFEVLPYAHLLLELV